MEVTRHAKSRKMGAGLTDLQWNRIAHLIPPALKGPRGQGRPMAHSPRKLLEGIMWVMRSGARWRDIPESYPPPSTCHRWFQRWCEMGVFEAISRYLVFMAYSQGLVDLSECYIDGTFMPAMKGGDKVGWCPKGKGTRVMSICDPHSLPLALYIDSASPHESQLVLPTLASSYLPEFPRRLIGDKAYDSDPLDELLWREYGIELIAPHRKGRKKTQDGRKLRRCKWRFRIERYFSWLKSRRYLLQRWLRKSPNFLGMLHIANLEIIL